MRSWTVALSLLGLIVQGVHGAAVKTIIEWDFQSSADVWNANDLVKDVRVEDSCLKGHATGDDPVIIGPLFEISASSYQYVQIRMRSSASGNAELFWTNTTEEPYSGFRPHMHEVFYCQAGDFRTYRLFPFWGELGKIIRLRLDPPTGSDFEIDWIRIVEIEAGPSGKTFFDFTKSGDLWMAVEDPQPVSSSEGIVGLTGEARLVSPKLDFDSGLYPWFSLMVRSRGAEHILLEWKSSSLLGMRSYVLPLKSDGRWHVYNVPIGDFFEWVGTITMLSFRISSPEGCPTDVRFAGAGNRPMGPPELDITNFGFRDAVNRMASARPAVVQAKVTNVGGQLLERVVVTLKNVRTVERSDRRIPRLGPMESISLVWRVRSGNSRVNEAVLEARSGEVKVSTQTVLRWYPRVDMKPCAYVPPPEPVRGEFDVGIYYFPGWHTYARWSVLDDYPERHPVLGYYREGDPEVADWHIKWMLEHGITFIVYDWYWSAGARQLEHALHNGFFNARYRDKIKFCLLWANHNPPNTSSEQDMENVVTYWLDNYFLRPEYFKVDGKPMVIIFSPGRLTADMGIEGVRRSFDKAREMARARGLPGIYFVACTYPEPERIKISEQEGYDALSAYNYPVAGDKGRIRAPYDDMVTGYQEFWNAIADATTLRYIPVTEPGWDSRPWHGPSARVRTGKSPEKFKLMLQNARRFVEQRDRDASSKIVLIEAWNEFGEGDYIEPHQEYGFEYLDVVREVFTSAPEYHVDITPADVGLGPYSLPKPQLLTAWEFNDPKDASWDPSQDLDGAVVAGGCLTAVSTSGDPAIYSSPLQLNSKDFRAVEVRMRVDKGVQGQLFWRATGTGFTEAASLRFALEPGAFRVYRLEVGASPVWKSRIEALRLDPTDKAGARIEIDYIKLVPR